MAAPGTARFLSSEQAKQRQLVVTKRRATALLGVVGVIFMVLTLTADDAGWVGYVQATAEASLVGGLADWFAVTALFRRPLGLPIPHTAIVVERKEQFGDTLGDFIQENFLTPASIAERVGAASVVPRVAAWLAEPGNATRVAGHVADAAVAVADAIRDEDVHGAIEGIVRERLEEVSLAPLAGRALRFLTEGGRHHELLDASVKGLDRYLDVHREELRQRLAQQSPWWLPGAVEDRVFERLLDGARAVLQEMAADREHPIRRQVESALVHFAAELETSEALRQRGDQLKRELLSQPQLGEWVASLWRDVKDVLRAQAESPDSELRQRLAQAIAAAGDRLRDDPVMAQKVNDGIEAATIYVADHFHGEIAALVSATIARWDAEETSRRLELLLGPDLQYIRINGTVVGAIAGLALYSIAQALG